MDLMKKTLSLLLAVLMAVSVFAGIQITASASPCMASVFIVDVTEPVVGAKPAYTAEKDTTKSYSVQIQSNISRSDNNVSKRNGVEWYDETDQKVVKYNDTFKAGHVYNVSVEVSSGVDTSSGDVYYVEYNNPPTNLWINGRKAEGSYYYYNGEFNNRHYYVHYTFEALPDTGWYYKDGASYYYKDGYLQKNKLVKDSAGDWYYADENGKMFRGWKKFGSNMRYFDYSTGVMAAGLKKASNGNWYFFNSNGFRQYGLQKTNGKWRYFDTSTGVMAKGWVKFGSNFRYFDKSNGFMATGLSKNPNGNWYYFASNGIRQQGWVKFGSNWRYFQSNGVMYANTTAKIGGKNYTFNASGIWVK
jgi:glucan-binding YG repeat protein